MTSEVSNGTPASSRASRYPARRSSRTSIDVSPPTNAIRLCPVGDQMGGGLARALLVLRRDERSLEAWKTPHHLHDRQARNERLQLARRRADRRRQHQPGGSVLAHRSDHLQLTDRVLRGVGEKRDECAALAGLLDADRQFDVEGVRQVVDDHAEHARTWRRAGSQRRDDRCSRAPTSRPTTRSRVDSATSELPPSTSDTVDLDTPARRATSTMVARPSRTSASLCAPSAMQRPLLARSNS